LLLAPRIVGCAAGSTYHREIVDFESLDSLKVLIEVELWQHNDFITAPDGNMTNNSQPIDMAQGQQSECHLGLDSKLFAAHVLKDAELHCIGNDIAVRDHNGFLALLVSSSSSTLLISRKENLPADPRYHSSSRDTPPAGHLAP
jgi:hypothetical protein